MSTPWQHRVRALAALAFVCALTVSCSSDRTLAEPVPRTLVPDESTSSWDDAADVQDRCLSSTPDGDLDAVTLSSPGISVPGALVHAVGRPRVGVVMLPQIGAAGLCGGLPYAAHLAEHGVTVLSIDACGYGESECDGDLHSRPETYVDVAAQWLRHEITVEDVVLVGASMGGSQTVRAVAAGASTDRWADLSGPSAWDGSWLLDVAEDVDQPGLVARARSDGAPAEHRAARELAHATGAAFVSPPAGHGWEMLLRLDGRPTALGRRLLHFIRPTTTTGDHR